MTELADDFRAKRERSRAKRAENRKNSAEILKSRRIEFESKNDGAHLIIDAGHCLVDFWPGTGKFMFRKGGIQGRGVNKLIEKLRKE